MLTSWQFTCLSEMGVSIWQWRGLVSHPDVWLAQAKTEHGGPVYLVSEEQALDEVSVGFAYRILEAIALQAHGEAGSFSSACATQEHAAIWIFCGTDALKQSYTEYRDPKLQAKDRIVTTQSLAELRSFSVYKAQLWQQLRQVTEVAVHGLE